MTAARSLLVIGGGVAGLAAAIAAARRGARVTLCESAALGRERVCGDLLSHEIPGALEALGLPDPAALGAVPLRRALFTAPGGRRLCFDLSGAPAHALTRRALEARLAAEARAAGAELHAHAPVRDIVSVAGELRFRAGPREGAAHLAVVAVGRRSPLDAPLGLPRARRAGHDAAVKTYFNARPGALEADVEIHLIRGGYVGLCAVEGDRIALCALLTAPGPTRWPALVEHLAGNEALDARLAALGEPLGPVRGLGRLGFSSQRVVTVDRSEGTALLFAGDAARMTPPFTGDGIAAALRTGRLAGVAATGEDPAGHYARAYAARGGGSPRLARVLLRALQWPGLLGAIAPLERLSPGTAERLFQWARRAAASG
ncbi:MAG: FAD-dependent monooxygenase [Polyangiaceae bacterium]|nr:FAD-dependent monooxygenase [Polyangiaceae bacterium]